MYFWCFGFRDELGFLNCDDVCMCVVNKQFELLEFLILKMTIDLNIWWPVPQFAPCIVRVLQMSILSWHLVMMKSIICPCRERGYVQVVLCASFCLNMVLVTIRSNSVHSANRSSPLELHFPIPYLSIIIINYD